MANDTLNIIEYHPTFAAEFERINTEWIEQMFTLEKVDQQMLQDPETYILKDGGNIWFAQHKTLGIVGTCALLKHAPGVFELTKMGVLSSARGLKAGETILRYVIEQACVMKAQCLFLLTNAKCEAAIHLYEKNGFQHDPEIMQTYGANYERCNVAMRWVKPH